MVYGPTGLNDATMRAVLALLFRFKKQFASASARLLPQGLPSQDWAKHACQDDK